MNFADGLRPALILEDFQGARETGHPVTGEAANNRAMGPSLSPQWADALGAVDELRQSIERHNLIKTCPDIAHDFTAVLAALEALRGDALFEAYWRAQLVRLQVQHPNMKAPPALGAIRPIGGPGYAHHKLPGTTPTS